MLHALFSFQRNVKLAIAALAFFGGSLVQAQAGVSTVKDNIGGKIKDDASAVAINEAKIIKVYGRGMDDALWENTYAAYASTWTGWKKVGGALTSAPSCTVRMSTTIDCFVRTTGNQISHISHQGGGAWSGWDGLGGSIKGAPFAASNGQHKILLVGWGTDGALWQRAFDEEHGGWSEWASLGGKITTPPACAVAQDGSNTYKCLAAGTDGRLWVYGANPKGTFGWSLFGGETSFRASPVYISGDNVMQVYITDQSASIARATWQKLGGLSGWEQLTGPEGSGPSCVVAGHVSPLKPIVKCFARGTDGSVESATITPN